MRVYRYFFSGLNVCCISAIFFFFTSHFVAAQNIVRVSDTLHWAEQLLTEQLPGGKTVYRLYFEHAEYHESFPELPLYSHRIEVPAMARVSARIVRQSTETLRLRQGESLTIPDADFTVHAEVVRSRDRHFAHITLTPVRLNRTGQPERLLDFELELTMMPDQAFAGSRDAWPSQSSLAGNVAGDSVYRFSVTQSGMYKLDYQFLKNTLGISQLDNIHPGQIRVYGIGGQMLPEMLSEDYFKELPEMAIHFEGAQNGQFNSGDHILLYAEGTMPVSYNAAENRLTRTTHLYTNEIHYLLKISTQTTGAKRIISAFAGGNAVYTTTSFDEVQRHEQELVNLLDYSVFSSGSGKDWFGEHFRFTLQREFNFQFPGIMTSHPVKLTARFASRALGSGNAATFQVSAHGQTGSVTIPNVHSGPNNIYAHTGQVNMEWMPPNQSNIQVNVNFQRITSTSEGWLDYIEIMARRHLNFSGTQLFITDIESTEHPEAGYMISTGGIMPVVWDVTDFHNPTALEAEHVGNNIRFKRPADQVRFFTVFQPGNLPAPTPQPAVSVYNLHNTGTPDMVIIYHRKFEQTVFQLAQHRVSMDDLTIITVDIQDIYNHFTGGHQDVSAVRNFVKMVYDKHPGFKYLLLFGDGSFDPKNNRQVNDPDHFIITYQTANGTNPLGSYTSDDYFGLLDDHEGNINGGGLDIAIGRLPARSVTDANTLVNKIIHYETSPVVLGDWLNRIVFVADDGDSNEHINEADKIAEDVRLGNLVFNIDKVYLDAFTRVSTLGDPRYPGVTEAINNHIFRGTHILNFMGHGGPTGWTQERVLQLEHMQTWENFDRLPLVVTATCTFGPFDDPDFLSAGEYLLSKTNGGAIALMTTVRVVTSQSNARLIGSTFEFLMYKEPNGEYLPIGEVLRLGKENSGAFIANSRKFALLGDPSMRMRMPRKTVVTNTINGQAPDSTVVIEALQHVTITGEVLNPDGSKATDFSGVITPTVFDKVATLSTLGNKPSSPVRTFQVQRNVLFRGNATVNNGEFTFSFIVPKDINYEIGHGKISYHAHDHISRHAHGYENRFKIGGTYQGAVADNQGPEIELYMNDESFVFGGLTDENPILLVKLYDESGINITGSGIGHDLTAVLDEDPAQTFILNDFYEAAMDDFRKGEVRYPLRNLEEGRHEIRVKAWDVYNNSAEARTEFVVAGKANIALRHVLNYPNPFTTQTQFMFEHNLNDLVFDVQVQIYTISGRLIKTIQQQVMAEGNRVTGIMWDGLDDFGDRIGRGTYVYKVRVRTPGMNGTHQQAESDFEKLVILK